MPENGVSPNAVVVVDTMTAAEAAAIGASAQRKISLRLLPVIAVGYGLAYMDRINISFAALQMNRGTLAPRFTA